MDTDDQALKCYWDFVEYRPQSDQMSEDPNIYDVLERVLIYLQKDEDVFC